MIVGGEVGLLAALWAEFLSSRYLGLTHPIVIKYKCSDRH